MRPKKTGDEIEPMRAAREKLARLIKECLKGKGINRIIGGKK